MKKAIKIFDASRDEMTMEQSINEWLLENGDIQIISTNLVWDESTLVYSILYSKV